MKFLKCVENWNRERRNRIKKQQTIDRSLFLVNNLKQALKKADAHIPTLIISYNNGVYVQNIVKQLELLKVKPIVIDNCSNSKQTIKILEDLESMNLAVIARSNYNFGHLAAYIDPVYSVLPEVFAYSDPDLEFNKKMPESFLDDLYKIAKQYNTFKAGLALDLNAEKEMIDNKCRIKKETPFKFSKEFTVREWEDRYWKQKLQNDDLEIYSAPVDTTFAVYIKSNFSGDYTQAVRLAGDYSAIHLPWFPKLDIMNDESRKEYMTFNKSMTWLKNS